MTDKTDLIEQIQLHVGFMKVADNPVSDHYHLKEIKRIFIEQACEAVRSQEVSKTFANDDYIEEWNLALEAAEQAILNKFNSSESS